MITTKHWFVCKCKSVNLGLSSPQLSSLNLPTPQLLPSIMCLSNNLPCHLGIQPLFIKSKPIQGLVVRSLVPTKPLANPGLAMAMNFQSNSPSSIMAKTPRGLTSQTLPMAMALDPISTTSIGSLSPKHFSSGCSSLGFSHVWGIHP